jgi:hypothetical protein
MIPRYYNLPKSTLRSFDEFCSDIAKHIDYLDEMGMEDESNRFFYFLIMISRWDVDEVVLGGMEKALNDLQIIQFDEPIKLF